jgi:nitroreductase
MPGIEPGQLGWNISSFTNRIEEVMNQAAMNERMRIIGTQMSEKDGQEFLDAAYARNYVGMRAALGSGDDATIYSVDDCGNTLLHYAMYVAKDTANSGGYCKFTLKWENYRNKPEMREERYQSAQEMVVFLLDQENKSKSNLINMVNKDDWASLNYCVEKNLIKTVRTLIEKGADVKTTPGEGHEHHGDTPLINASANDHFEMA